ncbi:MAG: Crp/Fnr family transcriptional regulator [Anaerolineae bacterium]|nr:Crp/Fnr family transcriptional regulator [Phycisphaerae bacterium]
MQDSNGRSFTTPANGTMLGRAILEDTSLEARRINVTSGTVIYEPDALAAHVHLIHRGQVRTYQVGENGASRLCEILGTDDWFGVAALANAESYGTRAVAVGPTVLTEIKADRLLTSLSRRPESLVELSRQLAQRLQNAREESAELMFRDTNQRLINALVRFARSAASTQREDGVVLNITHSQLAQAVGAARETISLALTQLRHQNLVRTGRNQLFFDPQALSQFRSVTRAVPQVA